MCSGGAEAVGSTQRADGDMIEANIIDALERQTEPFHPYELIVQLEAAGFRNADVRAAIWFLLDRQRVRLTTDLRLVMPTRTTSLQ
jgi:hypothetical protein